MFIKALAQKAPVSNAIIQLAPDEAFISAFKIALFFAIYICAPFVLYQVAKFKLSKEFSDKKSLIIAILSGFVLFSSGLIFAHYALIPLLMLFLMGFNSNIATVSFNISSYVSFCLQIMLISGIIFEFPLFLYLLGKTDFITSKKLISQWKPISIGALIYHSLLLISSQLFTLIFLAAAILAFYRTNNFNCKTCRKNKGIKMEKI
ncbi:MAG: twin-arginine translocase subunit TatC [Ignavibacteriales bacterium]|nr:twin-arginine translocase subunit TatC [Ignavibacteriales bacterium]